MNPPMTNLAVELVPSRGTSEPIALLRTSENEAPSHGTSNSSAHIRGNRSVCKASITSLYYFYKIYKDYYSTIKLYLLCSFLAT